MFSQSTDTNLESGSKLILPPRANFLAREIQISPTKKYCSQIQAKFGITLEGVNQNYIMPNAMSQLEMEKLLLTDRYRTNAHVEVHSRLFLGLFDGVFRYVTLGTTEGSGEATIVVRNELKNIADTIVAANREIFADFELENLPLVSLYHFIWGTACSINPADIKDFCIEPAEHRTCKQLWAKHQKQKAELEDRSGVKIGWQPTTATLNIIQQAFDQYPERIQASFVDRAKKLTLGVLDKYF